MAAVAIVLFGRLSRLVELDGFPWYFGCSIFWRAWVIYTDLIFSGFE